MELIALRDEDKLGRLGGEGLSGVVGGANGGPFCVGFVRYSVAHSHNTTHLRSLCLEHWGCKSEDGIYYIEGLYLF
jgi:hypothetical protein